MDQNPYSRIELVDEREYEKVQMKPTQVRNLVEVRFDFCPDLEFEKLPVRFNPFVFFGDKSYFQTPNLDCRLIWGVQGESHCSKRNNC